jgi:uncharacterized protein YrrD
MQHWDVIQGGCLMKSSAEIQGLPIFSLSDGAEIGRVKQLVIRPEQGKVDLFVVENEYHNIDVHVLPYAQAIGVGDFAVTVEQGDSIRELSLVEGARDLILLGYQVTGTRVLSRKGQMLGVVNEYYVDSDSGLITACSFAEADDPQSVKYFHRANIMTFGRDVIVIKQEDQIVSALDEQPTAEPTTEPSAQPAAAPQPSAPIALVETAATSEARTEASPHAYLVGKVLSADLNSESGSVLVKAGTVLTDEIIEIIKAEGPTPFMKLNRLAVDPQK